jgi:hypothetical protein
MQGHGTQLEGSRGCQTAPGCDVLWLSAWLRVPGMRIAYQQGADVEDAAEESGGTEVYTRATSKL